VDDNFTDQMVSLAKGASYPAIHSSDILDYEIFNAPISAQEEFTNFVHQIDKLKFDVQKSLEKTQMLFDSLMQQYFG
jgi:type I restriction enzyme S subunit